MREAVGALDELALGLVYHLQLYLADDCVVELDVDEDVVGALLQSVLYAHYLQLIWVMLTYMLQLLEGLHDFLLF